MDKIDEELLEAVRARDFDRASKLIQAGADVNARLSHTDTILKAIAGHHDTTVRRDGVLFLLENRADPCLLNDEGTGPLFSAVVAWDILVLKVLLDAGADPNHENAVPETLYDFAEFDYRFEVYDLHMPEEPTEADKASEDTWLDFLDRLAVKYGKPRPDILRLLRQRGAQTSEERRRRARQKSKNG